MTTKIECEKLIEIIKENYEESLPYFYKNLYEQLLDYICLFENSKVEEDQDE